MDGFASVVGICLPTTRAGVRVVTPSPATRRHAIWRYVLEHSVPERWTEEDIGGRRCSMSAR